MRKINTLLAGLFILFTFSTFAQEDKPLSDMLKGNVEPYYFSAMVDGDYDEVEKKVKAALKEEGFGVISTIEIDKAMKEKLGKDMERYVILGACSPSHAYQALQAEDKIGTMLPCNVVIQEVGKDKYEVAAVNPIASMMAIDNPELVKVAIEVTDNLKKVIARLEE
jgi:uncharacterized protein (DUF302 family)